jgi:Ca2+-binding EF-hand superfamily protein
MKKFKSKNVTDILNECDKDGNGVIDFKEFRACILKNS